MPQERKLLSNDVLGLIADIWNALVNLELANVDCMKLHEGVLKKFGKENGGDDKVVQEIAKPGQESDSWGSMLTRLVEDLEKAELDDWEQKCPGEEIDHQEATSLAGKTSDRSIPIASGLTIGLSRKRDGKKSRRRRKARPIRAGPRSLCKSRKCGTTREATRARAMASMNAHHN